MRACVHMLKKIKEKKKRAQTVGDETREEKEKEKTNTRKIYIDLSFLQYSQCITKKNFTVVHCVSKTKH
jgi:hypothetical protein